MLIIGFGMFRSFVDSTVGFARRVMGVRVLCVCVGVCYVVICVMFCDVCM